MIDARETHHTIVHRDEFAYCAHPHIEVAADGTWLVVFNRAPRRAFTLHPPEDPLFHNVLIRSSDQGKTWCEPQVVPGYGFSGTECAGLTRLRDGGILLNQWRFDWYPLGLARSLADQSSLTYPTVFMRGWLASPEHDAAHLADRSMEDLAPWVRGYGRTYVHISSDNGASFSEGPAISTSPYSGGYGMRGAIQLPDDTLVLPLSDVPNYQRVFVVISKDGGHTWSQPIAVAGGDNENHAFEEPAIARCNSGKLLIVLRDNITRHLHQTYSFDGGLTWSPARRLEIEGYPAGLLLLADQRLLMTYGWRQPDYGIRAVLSQDDGVTWDTSHTIRIRSDLPNRNLGYPATIEVAPNEFFTTYYGEDGHGTTCIQATYWRL